MGVRPEERVLLALSDSPQFIAAWYAIVKIGAVVGEVYTFLPPKDYEYYLNYSRARTVFADATTVEKIREVAPRCPYLEHIVVASGAQAQAGFVAPTGYSSPARSSRFATSRRPLEHDLSALLASSSPDLDPADTGKDEIALWKFTTGSTGVPKAAVHCMHDPLISYWSYALEVLGYLEDDKILAVPKMFFGYARDAAALFTFGVGAAGIIFPERSTPERLFDLIAGHRPTILVQVPTMINEMANHPQAATQDLSCLRFCISAGEALPTEVYHRWMDAFGVEVLDGIGSSEAYHIYISSRPGRVRPGSVGELVPGYEAEIVDSEGKSLGAGKVGELWLRGESTGLMYWNDHERSKRTFAGDLVRTGDLFLRDCDGYFWYRGRVDDLLKVSGIWVAPLEIENCLLEHPRVEECAVVGCSSSGLVITRAYVVTDEGGTAGTKGLPDAPAIGDGMLALELQDFVRSQLSPHKYPREVVFVTELPRTAQGKIDRKALSEAAAAERRPERMAAGGVGGDEIGRP